MSKQKKILCIDDQINNLKLIASTLSKAGNYELALAQQAKEADKILESFRPDLILLDIMMPETDGLSYCMQLKSRPQTNSIPIIFLTARKDEQDIIQGFEAGGIDYIVKPFYKSELLARVHTHLQLHDAYKTIHQQKELLKTANNAKDQLFSVISHDMRTPLASLQMMLDQLLESDSYTDTNLLKKYLAHMKISANDTFHLFDNLLNWSRGQLKKLSPSPVYFSIHTVIKSCINLLQPAAQRKQIDIYYHPQQRQPRIFADEVMIKTVVRNLLQNAIKFSYENTTININTTPHKQTTQLCIEDFGTGISTEQFNQAISNSYQTTTGTIGEKGTGLGLSLCNKFMKLNHGSLTIDNAKNKGSKFICTLPNHKFSKK